MDSKAIPYQILETLPTINDRSKFYISSEGAGFASRVMAKESRPKAA